MRCRYSSYAGLANLCDYAAAVFPVTTVDQELDRRPPPHDFMSETDEMIYNNCQYPTICWSSFATAHALTSAWIAWSGR